jgi:hypothetical protein
MLTGTKKFVLNQPMCVIFVECISFCRLANMEMLKQQLSKNRKSYYMEAAGDAGVSNRASFRVQLSETIKDGLRGSVGANSSDATALRRSSLWNAMRHSVSGVETDALLPLIRRCVFVAEVTAGCAHSL